jgi:hypothetical protein
MIGRTSVRAWASAIASDAAHADRLWMLAAAILLLVPCWAAVSDAHRPVSGYGMAGLSLFCLWSLLAFYHNSNNLIMMLPAFVFLLIVGAEADTTGFTLGRSARRGWWLAIASLQATMMFDVPTRLEALAPAGGWVRALILDFDRFVVLAVFASVAVLRLRHSRQRG